MPLPSGFLAMLTMSASLEAAASEDQWGNQLFTNPETIRCFLTSQTTELGGDTGEGRSEQVRVTTIELITDALGIEPKDRITMSGATYHVTHVDTPKDAQGVDLMHTVTASTTERG